jgi:hypothetical protein
MVAVSSCWKGKKMSMLELGERVVNELKIAVMEKKRLVEFRTGASSAFILCRKNYFY